MEGWRAVLYYAAGFHSLSLSLSLNACLQTKNIHTRSSRAKRFVFFTQIKLLVAHTGAEEAAATDADRVDESGAF